MRGLELPINTMIIIILVLLVLVAVIALLMGVWKPGTAGLNLEQAKGSACQMYVNLGCSGDGKNIAVNNFDADKDGTIENSAAAGDNLSKLATNYYGCTGETCIKGLCGC